MLLYVEETTITITKKIQLVQNRAARIVLRLRKFDHILEGMKSLKWLKVEEKLFFNECVMTYKCLHNKVPSYLSQKFTRRSEVHDRVTGRNRDLCIPDCGLTTDQRSFVFRGAKIWNGLPKGLKYTKSI